MSNLKLLERQQKRKSDASSIGSSSSSTLDSRNQKNGYEPGGRGGGKQQLDEEGVRYDAYGREIRNYNTNGSYFRPSSSSYTNNSALPNLDNRLQRQPNSQRLSTPTTTTSSSFSPSITTMKPDPYGRDYSSMRTNASGGNSSFLSERSTGPSQPRGEDTSRFSNGTGNLSAWTRPALEARVHTLERLLAEQQSLPSSSQRGLPIQSDERELAEHLQVTVRKNRELRAELEVTKNRLASLLEEREAFAAKLNQDNDSLQSLLEEAQRAKDALGNCIKALSMEKNELANRLALAEDEIVRLKSAQSGPIVQFDEIRGNIEDVAVINEGLSESLRQMKLKNPSFNDGISGQQ